MTVDGGQGEDNLNVGMVRKIALSGAIYQVMNRRDRREAIFNKAGVSHESGQSQGVNPPGHLALTPWNSKCSREAPTACNNAVLGQG